MKVETKEIPIPSTTRTVTTYVCETEGCDYSTSDKESAEHHLGSEHAAKAEQEIDDVTYVKLLTAEDHKAYLAARLSDRSRGEFSEPGWYAVKRYTVPCGRGCCSDDVTELVELAVQRSMYQKLAANTQVTIKQLDELEQAKD
jgi:hypothetical protein